MYVYWLQLIYKTKQNEEGEEGVGGGGGRTEDTVYRIIVRQSLTN